MMEDTGLRITELLHVKKKDIDFRTGIVTVTHPKSKKDCKCSRWEYRDLVSRKKRLVYADKNFGIITVKLHYNPSCDFPKEPDYDENSLEGVVEEEIKEAA